MNIMSDSLSHVLNIPHPQQTHSCSKKSSCVNLTSAFAIEMGYVRILNQFCFLEVIELQPQIIYYMYLFFFNNTSCECPKLRGRKQIFMNHNCRQNISNFFIVVLFGDRISIH